MQRTVITKWNPVTISEKKVLPNHGVQTHSLPPDLLLHFPVHVLLTKTWAFSTRNSNFWLQTDLDKSELYHTRQEPQALLRGGSHFKASFHLNTNRVNNWQSTKQIPSSFPFQMAPSSSFPPLTPTPALLLQRGSSVELRLFCKFSECPKNGLGAARRM